MKLESCKNIFKYIIKINVCKELIEMYLFRK